MKRALLATTFLVIAPFTASAQGIPVYDNANVIQRAAQFGQTIQQWNSQRIGMQNQFNQLVGIYGAATGGRPMDAVGQVLGMAGIYLPGLQSGDIGSALSGASQYGEAAEVIRRNLLAEPIGDDPDAVEMALRRTGLANRFADAVTSVRAAETTAGGHHRTPLPRRPHRRPPGKHGAAKPHRRGASRAHQRQRPHATYAGAASTQDRIEAMRDREAGRQSSQRWFDATSRFGTSGGEPRPRLAAGGPRHARPSRRSVAPKRNPTAPCPGTCSHPRRSGETAECEDDEAVAREPECANAQRAADRLARLRGADRCRTAGPTPNQILTSPSYYAENRIARDITLDRCQRGGRPPPTASGYAPSAVALTAARASAG